MNGISVHGLALTVTLVNKQTNKKKHITACNEIIFQLQMTQRTEKKKQKKQQLASGYV